jgi:hypothetical protein
MFSITTQKELRDEFWLRHPQFMRLGRTKQNGYNATIRSFWVDFVDRQNRDGNISDSLADRATL